MRVSESVHNIIVAHVDRWDYDLYRAHATPGGEHRIMPPPPLAHPYCPASAHHAAARASLHVECVTFC